MMLGSSKEQLEDLAAASGVYALLARLWMREVDHDLIQLLDGTELGDAFRAAGGTIPRVAELDELATEYCRLLIGPRNHLPPLQSVWARGELQSEITTSVQDFAQAVNYQTEPGQATTMLDHLAVQLEIMAIATRLLAGDSQHDDGIALAREFFRRHLSWPQPLLAAISAGARHAFFDSAARMTADFLAEEAELWLR